MKKICVCLATILFQIATNCSFADVIMPWEFSHPGGLARNIDELTTREPDTLSLYATLSWQLLTIISIIAIIIIVLLIIAKIKNGKK